MRKKSDYAKMPADELIIKLLRYMCYNTDGGAWLEMRERLYRLEELEKK